MFSASCAYVSRLPQAQDHTVRFQKEQADPGGGGGRRTGNAGHQKTECSFQPLRLDNAPIYPVCLAWLPCLQLRVWCVCVIQCCSYLHAVQFIIFHSLIWWNAVLFRRVFMASCAVCFCQHKGISRYSAVFFKDHFRISLQNSVATTSSSSCCCC